VDKQIKHLQKQAEKAEKYTELKKQERQVKQELLAMRWQLYHQSAVAIEEKLQSVAIEHNNLFGHVREVFSQIEAKRNDYKIQQQMLNQIQADYYNAVSEVSSLEQKIRFNETSHEETVEEIKRLQQQADHSQTEIENDLQALETFKQDIIEAETSLEAALEQELGASDGLHSHQQLKQDWQQAWDHYRTESAKTREQAQVQRLTIQQQDNSRAQLQIRLDKLHTERNELSAGAFQQDIEALAETIAILESQREEIHTELEQHQQNILERRGQVKHFHNELHQSRTELQNIRGKAASLELLQQHAMGKDNQKLNVWLDAQGLSNNRRLAEFLEVSPGWENAVETVLAANLEAICVDTLDPHLNSLHEAGPATLTLFENNHGGQTSSMQGAGLLVEKVNAPWDLHALLGSVYCSENHQEAKALVAKLASHESVITRDGFWFGSGWLSVRQQKDAKTGVLQREKELRALKYQLVELENQIIAMEESLFETETALKNGEAAREQLQSRYNLSGQELSRKQSEISSLNAHFEQQQRRIQHISSEQEAITGQLEEIAEQLASAKINLEQAEAALEIQESRRIALEKESELLQSGSHGIELAANEARQQVFALKSRLESLRASETLTAKQIERLHIQQEQAIERINGLQTKIEQTLMPLDDEKSQLIQRAEDKQELEIKLKEQQQILEQIEAEISQQAEDHARSERNLEQLRDKLDKLRLELQESKVRQQSVNEQLEEINSDVEAILAALPEEALEPEWKRKADQLAEQIDRLGTINLTAIEEFQAQSERMKFLDEQHADLTEALDTLEEAINKIDKESRQRFQETFDKINAGLQEKFPRLFGGGQAYLELTEDDLLATGVNIIARPPGKRNSSIHLLSGGEKALTAVALVFAIFELNPAPFCLLDEVDAPLDDANVGRFSQMVEAMSESVQFLYISHNKVTMEIAKQLAGVTMKEPGVSRMVAVDIEEAISLAEH
jgi:chromosome segregation protein